MSEITVPDGEHMQPLFNATRGALIAEIERLRLLLDPMLVSLAPMIEMLAQREDLIRVARRVVVSELVEYRNSGMYAHGLMSGLVLRDPDDHAISGIRMDIETALRIGLQAIADHVKRAHHLPKDGS